MLQVTHATVYEDCPVIRGDAFYADSHEPDGVYGRTYSPCTSAVTDQHEDYTWTTSRLCYR